MGSYYESITGKKKKKKNTTSSTMFETITGKKKENTLTSEKEEKDTFGWFKSSDAFDDGYNVGDVSKTIIGSTADALTHFTKGVTGIVEGATDLVTYGAAGVASLVGADETSKKWKKSAQNSWNDNLYEGLLEKTDKYSVLGDKSDSVAQGVGYYGGMVALQSIGVPWQVTSGVTSMSSGLTEAFNEGADTKDAIISSLVGAAAEMGSEYLFGGLGKLKGTGALDDAIVGKVTKGIKNKFIKNLAQYGLKSAGEGVEEIASGWINEVGKRLTYLKDEDKSVLKNAWEGTKDYWTQQAAQDFWAGTLVSAISGGSNLAHSMTTGRSVMNNLTANEQKVLDTEVENRFNKELKNKKNQNLTNRQKNQLKTAIEEKTMADLQKGKISAKTIQDTLGENKVITEGKKQDSYLVNSYNNEYQKSQSFQFKATNDEVVNNVYEKAKAKGLNNSVQTHEVVDLGVKVAKELNLNVDFTTTEEIANDMIQKQQETLGRELTTEEIDAIKESASKQNGYKKGNNLVLNVDSNKAGSFVIGHEVKHFLEGDKTTNNTLNKALIDYAKFKGIYQTEYDRIAELYKKNNQNITEEEIQQELMADFTGEFFTDEAFVSNLVTTNPTFLQKMANFFKELYYKATNNQEKLLLQKINNTIQAAYSKTASNRTNLEVDRSYTVYEKPQNKADTETKIEDNVNLPTIQEISQEQEIKPEIQENLPVEEKKVEKLEKKIEKSTKKIDKTIEKLDKIEAILIEQAHENSMKLAEKFKSNLPTDTKVKNIEGVENIKKKYDSANKVDGNKKSIVLANGEQLSGTYKLLEAGNVTASHNAETFEQSEGFPTTEKGTTVNDRDYQSDKNAQNEVNRKSKNYDGRAFADNGVIVTKDGIVVSGNDRTMSGDLAAKNNTDAAYIEYLKENAEQFGFTKEQIETMNHPRVVFELDTNVDYDTKTFAKFNKDSKKSKSVSEKAKEIGKTIDNDTITSVADVIDKFNSIDDLYNSEKATRDLINILQSKGIVDSNELSEIYNGSKFTGTGKDLVESVILGSVISEENAKYFSNNNDLKFKIMKVAPAIIQNKTLGDYSINEELNNAIETYKKASTSKLTINEYTNQYNIFGDNDVDLVTKRISQLLETKGYKNLKNFIEKYNAMAEAPANGQRDIFSQGEVATKEDILKSSLNINDETELYQYSLSEDIANQDDAEIKLQEKYDWLETKIAEARETGDSIWRYYANEQLYVQDLLDKVRNSKEDEVQYSLSEKKLNKSLQKLQDKRNNNEELTEKEFYKLYSAHKILGESETEIQNKLNGIINEGFNGTGGFGTNVLPAEIFYDSKGEPIFAPDRMYAPKKGEYVLFVPEGYVDESNGRYRVAQGFNPKDFEIVKVERDYQPYYELYKKNIDNINESNKQYSLSDNQGRELSEGQQEYFKDSQVRDSEGNLLTVYHGTNNDFTIFDKEFIGKNTNNEGIFGKGFYFTEKKSLADGYNRKDGKVAKDGSGKTMELYLDMKKPFYWNSIDTKEKMESFIEETGMPKYVLRWNNTLKNQMAPITDVKAERKFSEILQKNGYDGVIYKYDENVGEYVVFNSNQVKKIDNLNPTENDDINLSLSEQGEGTNNRLLPTLDYSKLSDTKVIAEENLPLEVKEKTKGKNVQLAIDGFYDKELGTPTRRQIIDRNRMLAREQLGDILSIKDKKKGILYQINTMKRNLRDIMPKEQAAEMYNTYFKPITENNAEAEKFITSYNERIQKYNINNEESTYIQMIGEKKYNPESTLTDVEIENFYNKNRNKIDQSKCERAVDEFRNIYDELIGQINDTLVNNGYKPIEYRKGYFPHFIEEKATSPIGKLAEKLGWKVKQGTLPTDIAGITDQFKPGKVWTSFSQQRTGDATDYNALKGLDNYLRGAADTIFHTNDIQKLRALENEIRYQYSDKGIKEKIDLIYADESLDVEEKNEAIYNLTKSMKDSMGLGNFATEIRNYTDNLANKKAFGDRSMEQAFGRDTYSIMQNINSRISANMVGANISSALTNFIPITQAWSQCSTKNIMRGMYEAIKNTIKNDGFEDGSTFLINRTQQAERLYQTGLDKINNKLSIPFEAVDSFTSNTIVRAKYYDNIEAGMSETQAMDNANEFAKDVMAGRSKGDMPTIFNQKNPLVKLLTAFQLEVNNQYGYMFKDVPTDMGDEAKEKLVKAFIKMFLGAFIYNYFSEKITGRKSAFSPIDMAIDDIQTMTNENMDFGEKISAIAEDTVQELPFVGGIMGGGRLPIQSAIPYENPLEMVTETLSDASKIFDEDEAAKQTAINNLVKEWSKPVYYVLMPFAGGQIKKTVEGLSMYDENLPIAGSYTSSGKLRFEADTSTLGKLQAAVFGQYASKNAREYFDNGYSALTEKQVNAALDAGLGINEYREYQTGIKNAKKQAKDNDESQTEAVYDYIYNLPLATEQKNSLLNSSLGNSNTVKDKNGYIKYVDSNNKAYWYDEENDTLYNRNYHEVDISKLDELTQYSNEKDISNYGEFSSLEEFTYANNNPERYSVISQITDFASYNEYKSYIEDISDEYSEKMAAATTSKQKEAISNKKKAAIRKYINSLGLNKYQKMMLEKMAAGYSIKNYRSSLQPYINSLDLSKEEKQMIDSVLFD